MTDRTLEENLLGMALQSSQNLQRQLDLGITTEHFSQKYRRLFQTMKGLFEKEGHYDVNSLGSFFPNHHLELANLLEKNSAMNVDFFAKEFLIQHCLSKVCKDANELVTEIFEREPHKEIDAIISKAKHIIDHFDNESSNILSSGESTEEIYEQIKIDKEKKDSGAIQAYRTGWKGFDRLTGGLKKGSYFAICARPKKGKTTIWINLLKKLMIEGKKITVFSIEMSGKQIFEKIHSSMSRVKSEAYRDNKMTEDDKKRWEEAEEIGKNNFNIFVYGKHINKFETLERLLLDRIKKGECEIAVIDYYQKYRIDPSRNIYDDLSEVSGRIQNICKTYDIPIIVIAQLNRGFDHDKPENAMSYILGGGAIEQDADTIAILTRENSPSTEELARKHPSSSYDNNHIIDGKLDIQGNRFGREDVIHLKCEFNYNTILEK